MGKLTVSYVELNNAGIGGNANQPGGTITVNGGQVTAYGGIMGAGIGGGCYGTGGTIVIDGGNVTATGGDRAAGIGGGNEGAGGTITIDGGNVTATGGNYAAGIGGGYSGAGGTITITGGQITANGYNSGVGIGDGADNKDMPGTISLGLSDDAGDFILASSYAGTVKATCHLKTDEETPVEIAPGEVASLATINGKKLIKNTVDGIDYYSITVSETIHGSVTSVFKTAAAGDIVTLRVTPDDGYELSEITVTKTDDSTTTVSVVNNAFTMPNYDVTVSATFTAIDFAIKLGTITGGSVTAKVGDSANATTAPCDGEVTLTVTPSAGYEFRSLTVDGADVTGSMINNTYTFTMPAHPVTVSATFSAWKWLQNQLAAGTDVTLDKDYVDTYNEGALVVPAGKDVTLDLHGHVIDRGLSNAAEKGYVIRVETGTLTVIDNDKNATHSPEITYTDPTGKNTEPVTVNGGVIKGGNNTSLGGGVYVDNGGTFKLSGGTITGNAATQSGGGVYVKNSATSISTFKLSGGTIAGNTASSGGGVYVSNGAEFNLNNGTITRNTASGGSGGGVNLDASKMTMSAGTISYNKANASGGGVYVGNTGNDKSTFIMHGGTISENMSDSNGGGVDVDKGTFKQSSGSIGYNRANTNGGGVSFGGEGGAFERSGGTINNNTAQYNGGGVYKTGGTLTLSGCNIYANNANADGGGVYLAGGAQDETTMTGGKINGNTACINGGGVSVGTSRFTLSGGDIHNNSALGNGGGVSVNSDATFTMTGGSIISNQVLRGGKGGGVDLSQGTLKLSGAPTIKENIEDPINSVANNVFLHSGQVVTVAGALLNTEDKIGVTVESSIPVTITSDYAAIMGDTAPATVFASDNTAYSVLTDADGEAVIGMPVTIKFDANGGSGTMADEKVASDADSRLNANAFTLEGHTFKAWNTREDGTWTRYADGATINISGDVTLYAQWYADVTLTANSKTVTCNGSAQSVSGYTCSVAGLSFPGVSASATGTAAGTYPVKFSGVTLKKTADSTDKYVVAKVVEGTLTVKAAESTPASSTPSTPSTPAGSSTPAGPTVYPIYAPKKDSKATIEVGKPFRIELGGQVGKGFKSNKSKVVTVDSNGLVTPLKAGKARITFKVGKKKRTITLKVLDPTVPKRVSLNMSGTVPARVGETVRLVATLPDGANSDIKWTSSNKKVATVAGGQVVFKKPGKVTITATAVRGKKKAKVKFKVSK